MEGTGFSLFPQRPSCTWVGATFASWIEVKEIKQRVETECGRVLKVKVNNQKGCQYELRCKNEGCCFLLKVKRPSLPGSRQAQRGGDSPPAVDPASCLDHSCQEINVTAKKASEKQIVQTMMESGPQLYLNQPAVTIQQHLAHTNGMTTNQLTVYRARADVRRILYGNINEGAQKVEPYLESVAESYQKLGGNGSFHYEVGKVPCRENWELFHLAHVFVVLPTIFQYFDYCWHVVALDATFLTGGFGGTMLAVCGIDPCHHYILLAYALVDQECRETWGPFLLFLAAKVQLLQLLAFLVVSDREKGIVQGILGAFPNAVQLWCTRHLFGNLCSARYDKKTRDLDWQIPRTFLPRKIMDSEIQKYMHNAAKATNKKTTMYWLQQIKEVDAWSYAWLELNPREFWLSGYCSLPTHGITLSNAAEGTWSMFKSRGNRFTELPLVQLMQRVHEHTESARLKILKELVGTNPSRRASRSSDANHRHDVKDILPRVAEEFQESLHAITKPDSRFSVGPLVSPGFPPRMDHWQRKVFVGEHKRQYTVIRTPQGIDCSCGRPKVHCKPCDHFLLALIAFPGPNGASVFDLHTMLEWLPPQCWTEVVVDFHQSYFVTLGTLEECRPDPSLIAPPLVVIQGHAKKRRIPSKHEITKLNVMYALSKNKHKLVLWRKCVCATEEEVQRLKREGDRPSQTAEGDNLMTAPHRRRGRLTRRNQEQVARELQNMQNKYICTNPHPDPDRFADGQYRVRMVEAPPTPGVPVLPLLSAPAELSRNPLHIADPVIADIAQGLLGGGLL